MVGGGVGDSYQLVEEEYQLTRSALQLLLEHGYPVHVLNKSALALQDIDILKKINQSRRAMVSYSFSSMDEGISPSLNRGRPLPASS